MPRQIFEADPSAARRRFAVPEGDRCIAVVGGSLGALSLNEAAFEAFGGEASGAGHVGHPWVIHVAGRRDFTKLKERWAMAGGSERYLLREYEPSLGDVLAACDLVIARAGGSVMEIAAAGRPAILVPYPHATADHQTTNARWMESGGAAIVIPDAECSPERLGAEADALLEDGGRLAEMAAAARGLSKPDAAQRIATEVLSAAGAS